jgi:hypothetical protein
MKALVVYESMFGNTRQVAEAVAQGIGAVMPVEIRAVADVDPNDTVGIDLLVIGAPTHAFGLSLPASRVEAKKMAADATRGLTLEPGAVGPGVREFIASLPVSTASFATFDTRMMPGWMKSSARKYISNGIEKTGREEIAAMSFSVDRGTHLREGELSRAVTWAHEFALDASPLVTPFST